MRFVRFSGAGNTFLLADNRNQLFDIGLVKKICYAEDVDGLILVENSKKADAYMRIYNRDGSEAEMCGNGLRCFVVFLKDLGIERTLYQIETSAGVHQGWHSEQTISRTLGFLRPTEAIHANTFQNPYLRKNPEAIQGRVFQQICVQFPKPQNMKLSIQPGLHFVDTGVPHAIMFFPEIEHLDVQNTGKKLRDSPLFGEAGSNINFAKINFDNSLNLRTYERGVECETLACGTGAVAAACIASFLYHLDSPIVVHVKSGERLKISFSPDWSKVTLEGPVQKEDEVVLELKDQNLKMIPL